MWYGCGAVWFPRPYPACAMLHFQLSYVVFNRLNNVAFSWLFLFLSGWSLRTIFLYARMTSSFVAPGVACRPT